LFRRKHEKQILFCVKIRENAQIKWVEIQGFLVSFTQHQGMEKQIFIQKAPY
jgi:hypothetical protein